jgi:surface carbohydrate biosynthesis protein
MVIYLVLEIAVRELYGHLLLAVLAASKGHQVVIGTNNDLWLYKRMKLLPPGAYVVKNMNIPSQSEQIYRNFLNDGFDIYCHEAEASILWSDFEVFLKEYCIKSDQFFPFKGVFCWGERDYIEYTKMFSGNSDVFHITGSPRVDLWSSKFLKFWERDYTEALKPYVLYISNNSWAVGKRHWTKFLAIQRDLELLNSEENERNLYKAIHKDILMVENAVFSLRELSRKNKNVNFIIRPHPMDNEVNWRDAVGEYENIHVIYKDSITAWITGATALIHNSCTSAIEAVIHGVPVISYVPAEISDVLGIANKCGVKVYNHNELDYAVTDALTNSDEINNADDSNTLLTKLVSIDQKLASLKIVEAIEKGSNEIIHNNINITGFMAIAMAKQSKTLMDKFRKIDLIHQKNMEFDKTEVRGAVKKFSKILGVPCPKIRFASNTTMLIG